MVPIPAANIVTRKMIFAILRVVISSGLTRPAPSCHEIHQPTVESTKPTTNPESQPKPSDLAGSDIAPHDAIAADVAQRHNEIGESREYGNLRRCESEAPIASKASTATMPKRTPLGKVPMKSLSIHSFRQPTCQCFFAELGTGATMCLRTGTIAPLAGSAAALARVSTSCWMYCTNS